MYLFRRPNRKNKEKKERDLFLSLNFNLFFYVCTHLIGALSKVLRSLPTCPHFAELKALLGLMDIL